MSLTKCIKKAGKALSPADAQTVRDYQAQLRADGIKIADAGREAVDLLLDDVLAERAELTAEIQELGGDVPQITTAPAEVSETTEGTETPVVEEPAVEPRFSKPAQGFYSQLTRVADQKLPGKGSPASFKQALQAYARKGQVKQEELDWSGVSEWLDDQTGTLTKDQVMNQLQAAETPLQETNFEGLPGARGPWAGLDQEVPEGAEGPVHYEEAQLPGGFNYREILLQVPAEPVTAGRKERLSNGLWRVDTPGGTVETYKTEAEADRAMEEMGEQFRRESFVDTSSRFASGHFSGMPNIVAWGRTSEFDSRDGGRTLFVHEVQSDWDQTGRRRGFQKRGVWQVYRMWGSGQFVLRNDRGEYLGEFSSAEQAREYASTKGAKNVVEVTDASGPVPDQPFKQRPGTAKGWPMLMMKRLIRHAVERGYDRIAWPATLDQISEIEGWGDQVSIDMEADQVFLGDMNVTPIMERYTKHLPRELKKYVKKWGATVGRTEIETSDMPPQRVWSVSALREMTPGGIFHEGSPTGPVISEQRALELLAREPKSQSEQDAGGVYYGHDHYDAVNSIEITPQMRESVMAGQPMFSRPEIRPNEFAAENDRIRERDNTLWKKAKRFGVRQFRPGGLLRQLPENIFESKIARDNQFNVAEFDTIHLVGVLDHAVRRDYGSSFEKLSKDDLTTLQEALSGQVDLSIPQNTRTAIYTMRQYIDRLSRDYAFELERQINEILETGGTGAEQKATLLGIILNNMGQYVHRSYRVFDDPKWFKREELTDEILADARRYFTERYMEEGETEAEAKRLAEVMIEQHLKTGTAYDSLESFIKESKLGEKDLSVLMKRNDIAPEVRALLGEYIDPRVNFARTVAKMSRLIWNQRFLDRVKEVGMGSFLFEGTDRPPEATAEIKQKSPDSYSPLNGLWTFPDVDQAFKDAVGKEQMADWYRTVVSINGLVKYGKTVLSPVTAARNWQSAALFAVANGHFNMKHTVRAVEGLREYFTQKGEGGRLAYLRRLKQLGVVYDSPYAGEMMRLLEESKLDELMRGRSGGVYKTWRNFNKFATKAYQYGDDFWKIIGFENEKRALMEYMPEAEAEIAAAERIRNTYPTYSMVPRAVNWLRRFPLAGTFVSFPAEIIRTTANILRYTAQDFQQGRTKLGMKRVAGMAIMSSFAHAIQELSKSWLGLDDDDEEAVRLLAAPWQRNATLWFTGRDKNGNLRYFDGSFIDPYNWWKRPITAMMRNQPWQDKAASAILDLVEPFLGQDIAAGAILEIINNKKQRTGGPVWNEKERPHEIAKDMTTHLLGTIQPGLTSQLFRTWKAIDGQYTPSGDRKYDKMDEARAWIGWRTTTLDPKVALSYRAPAFSKGKQKATRALSQLLRSPNEVSEADLKKAYDSGNRIMREVYREAGLLVQASVDQGLSPYAVKKVLKSSGISEKDISVLLRGGFNPIEIKERQRRDAIKRARVTRAPEVVEDINRRYRYVMGLSRNQ